MTLAPYDGHPVSIDASASRLRWSAWNPVDRGFVRLMRQPDLADDLA